MGPSFADFSWFRGQCGEALGREWSEDGEGKEGMADLPALACIRSFLWLVRLINSMRVNSSVVKEK